MLIHCLSNTTKLVAFCAVSFYAITILKIFVLHQCMNSSLNIEFDQYHSQMKRRYFLEKNIDFEIDDTIEAPLWMIRLLNKNENLLTYNKLSKMQKEIQTV